MPISVVVGGQFGSEGKGKVGLELVRRDPKVAAAVRVGGPNSGHTGARRDGTLLALRHIPAAAIDGNVQTILPPGSYIDVEVLLAEIRLLGLEPEQVAISPLAHVILPHHKAWERTGDLVASIGSTGSGTGAAVIARVGRLAKNIALPAVKAEEAEELQPYLRDTTALLRELLDKGRRVVIEGTQGFGLSLLHSEVWPKATSRDTTAAGFISEAGVSPLDVDDVTMVLRCHPIRVAGDSGPLVGETSWDALATEAGIPGDIREYTTVTRKERRVGRFDGEIVRRAIAVNKPSRIVLNHLDYVDPAVRDGEITSKALKYVRFVEGEIGCRVDWLGVGPANVRERPETAYQPACF